MNELRELTIADRTYLVGTLDCFKQFSVARRLGPLLLSFFSALTESPAGQDIEALVSAPLVAQLAKMPEEDVDHVLKTCLSVVRVKQVDGSSSPIYDAGSKQLRYQDLQMPAMMQLVVAVIKDNLGSFFPTGQPASSQG